MGPCIGVAIISKNKEDKMIRVGLAHIDALTELESLGDFVYNSSKDADSVDVVMVSSGNDRERAREILKQILINPELEKKANVMTELDGSTSFAVNTLTGSVYKEIPMSAFIQVHKPPKALDLEKVALKMSSSIQKSPLYDPEKRKNATSALPHRSDMQRSHPAALKKPETEDKKSNPKSWLLSILHQKNL